MKKSKTRKQTTFTAQERDAKLAAHVSNGLNMMHVCRHSGSPDFGMLIGRSIFPLLVTQIHVAMASHHRGQSLNQQLEDLKSEGIISEPTHLTLRRAAASLGDFGSGRDIADVIAACDVLHAITRTEAFYSARQVRRATKERQAAHRRRPVLLRWASAAAGLFTAGSAS